MNCLHVHPLLFVASTLCAVAVEPEVPTCVLSDEDSATFGSVDAGHHKGTSYALLQKVAYLQDLQEQSRRLLDNSAQAARQSSNNTESTSSKVDLGKSSLAQSNSLSKDSVDLSRRRRRRRRKAAALAKLEGKDTLEVTPVKIAAEKSYDALKHAPNIRKAKLITQRSLEEERRAKSGIEQQKAGLHTPLATAFHVLGGSSESNASLGNSLQDRVARTGGLAVHDTNTVSEMNTSIEDAGRMELDFTSDASLAEDIPQDANSSDDLVDAPSDSFEIVQQKGAGTSDMSVAKATLANRMQAEAEAKMEARLAKAAAHDAAIETKNAERMLGQAKNAENAAFAKIDESETSAKEALEKKTEAERALAERTQQLQAATSSAENEEKHIQLAKRAREVAEQDAQRKDEEARLASARVSEQQKLVEALTAQSAEATKALSEKQGAEKDALWKVSNMNAEVDKAAQSVEMAGRKVQKVSGILRTATEKAKAAAEAEQKAEKDLEEAQAIELGKKKAADMARRRLAEQQAQKEESSANRLAAEKVVEDFNSNETKNMKELADAKIVAEKKLAEKKILDQMVSEKKAEEKEAADRVTKEDELAKKLAVEKLDAEKLLRESLEALNHSNATLIAEKDIAEQRVAERQKAEAEVAEKKNAENDAVLKAKTLAEAGQSATEERANAEMAVARKTITRAASEIWKGKSKVPLYDWAAALWNGS